jgi:hypothetical protein
MNQMKQYQSCLLGFEVPTICIWLEHEHFTRCCRDSNVYISNVDNKKHCVENKGMLAGKVTEAPLELQDVFAQNSTSSLQAI